MKLLPTSLFSWFARFILRHCGCRRGRGAIPRIWATLLLFIHARISWVTPSADWSIGMSTRCASSGYGVVTIRGGAGGGSSITQAASANTSIGRVAQTFSRRLGVDGIFARSASAAFACSRGAGHDGSPAIRIVGGDVISYGSRTLLAGGFTWTDA